MHSTRLSSLLAHVEGLLIGQRLGLTAVGRPVRGKTREKDKIKRADRLVGNPHLTGERRAVYGWIVRLLVGGARHPHLIVDWSEVDAARTLFLLRAAVVIGGRTLPVYEEVHTRYHHPEATGRFLKRLAALLPPACRPVIVTDAGFRCPWYKAVEALGWYYVGRVRHRDNVCLSGHEEWVSNKVLHAQATTQPRAPVKIIVAPHSDVEG